MYLSLYCKGLKRVTQGLRVRGSWRPNRNCNILTPTFMAVKVVSFSFSRCSTGGPEAHSAGWWFSLLHLISIFSEPQLTRAPMAPSNGWWFSLLHLISIFSEPQLIRAPMAPNGPFGLMWLSLPHLVYNSVRSLTATHQGPQGPIGLMWLYLTHLVYLHSNSNWNSWLLSWLSYIIVQRPLSRLLDFWNRMLDRHQAEITVMQFTGHSLPVHQSMSAPWEFFYLVPFHQPISAHAISSHNRH